ncbi:MAG TPA: hypothetical protein VMU10_01430 [Desulfomonilia bacterium]|nr:hypothetical protein [Desulfomonilia bacterium]
MKLPRHKLVPLLFALLGVLDFTYGLMRSDMISLGMGTLLVVVSVYVFKREIASGPDEHKKPDDRG